jgi:hypothetical protein
MRPPDDPHLSDSECTRLNEARLLSPLLSWKFANGYLGLL